MYRIFIAIILSSAFSMLSAFGQDTIAKVQEIEGVRVSKNYRNQYNQRLEMLRRVYPLAMQAKALLIEYDEDLSEIEKKRKQKKYGREAQNALKDEFNFNIKDLYDSEGRLLMRLIHRETGLTVAEIIGKYKSEASMNFQTKLAKMYGQDITSHYEPENRDYITEIVIRDIESGLVEFDFSLTPMSRAGFRTGMKEYRSTRKANRKTSRESRRANKRK